MSVLDFVRAIFARRLPSRRSSDGRGLRTVRASPCRRDSQLPVLRHYNPIGSGANGRSARTAGFSADGALGADTLPRARATPRWNSDLIRARHERDERLDPHLRAVCSTPAAASLTDKTKRHYVRSSRRFYFSRTVCFSSFGRLVTCRPWACSTFLIVQLNADVRIGGRQALTCAAAP